MDKNGALLRGQRLAPKQAQNFPKTQETTTISYSRPKILQKSWAEIQQATDQHARPILCPPRERSLQWNTGYAEVRNAQKSHYNEDQAVCCELKLLQKESDQEEWVFLCSRNEEFDLKGYYWALFDGRCGPDAALLASKYLHCCIIDQLEAALEGVMNALPPMHLHGYAYQSDPQFVAEKQISAEQVVTGALEKAFLHCDKLIGERQISRNQQGGCTALVVLSLQEKLYMANAGDCRAIIVQKNTISHVTSESTPEHERQRIQYMAFLNPALLGDEFPRYEFPRRLKHKDMGQKVLYRDHFMTGWGYKTVEKDDLKYPLVHGQGKQTQLMGTLGVSRGFGDHLLKVYDTNLHIKPFLSCVPQVTIFDFANQKVEENDVLVMATDGLWDVFSNEEVAYIVRSFLSDKRRKPCRFAKLAQHLLRQARGMQISCEWTREDGTLASYDEISVFVIPLHKQTHSRETS
uniref:Protein phosphatase, Mg2+/Mn2+ dependent 1M n=1 Tax=Latimeria chalumnae TaxID=7897 RepID=H3BGM1_LATCH